MLRQPGPAHTPHIEWQDRRHIDIQHSAEIVKVKVLDQTDQQPTGTGKCGNSAGKALAGFSQLDLN